MTDPLAYHNERKTALEQEHQALQTQYARSQRFLNELGGKIALVQGRIAENTDTLKALEPTAAPPQEEPPK